VGLVGAFTLISRLLGLARDVLMAGFFGTSLPMSAFVVAFMIPNLFRRLFGEGALSAAFVPVFVETRAREGDAAAWLLVRRVVSLLTVVLIGITAVGWGVSSIGLGIVDAGTKAEAILSLLRIMLPYMVFICLAALSMGILNAFRHFGVPAATPVLLNLIWIVALVGVVPRVRGGLDDKIVVVAWAVLVAGVAQLACQVPVLLRHGYRPGWEWAPRDPKVGRVVCIMGPAALGLAVAQVNVVIDKLLAAWVAPWAPAALFYSERMVYLPLGVFATALGTVLLPALSGHVAEAREERIPGAVNHALRNLLYIMTPASVGLVVMAEPIINMIFQWRQFDEASTAHTVVALQCYAPGLAVFSMVKVFVPVFYARQDTRTPVKVAVLSVALNLALNLLFVWTWPHDVKHAGLALATVLSSAFNGLVLAVLVHRQYGSPGWGEILGSAARALGCSLGMAVVVAAAYPRALAGLNSWGLHDRLAQLGAVLLTIAGGALVYGSLSLLVGSREPHEIRRALQRG
jgi:putative peptidoglycan lipid II flippase